MQDKESPSWVNTTSTLGNTGSRYWLGESANRVDLIGVAARLRAISNFVKIAAGADKQFRVRIASKATSRASASGDIIVGADIDADGFDVAVGLALHEGSHLRESTYGIDMRDYKVHFEPKVYGRVQYSVFKELLNVLEDRRIDKISINRSPGYRVYYDALYSKYYNNDVAKLTYLPQYGVPEISSYLLHIKCMINPTSNPYPLPGWNKIKSLIDLPRINRFKSTVELGELVAQLFNLIYAEIDAYNASKKPEPQPTKTPPPAPPENPTSDEQEETQGKTESSQYSNDDDQVEAGGEGQTEDFEDLFPLGADADSLDTDKDDSEPDKGDTSSTDTDSETDADKSTDTDDEDQSDEADTTDDDDFTVEVESAGTDDGTDTGAITPEEGDQGDGAEQIVPSNMELSNSAMKRAQAALNKLESLIAGELDKKTMRDKADAEFIDLAADPNSTISSSGWKGVQSVSFDLDVAPNGTIETSQVTTRIEAMSAFLDKAINEGTLLSSKLKTRDEDRSLYTSRLKTGKIDPRLLSEAGFGNHRIFGRLDVDKTTPTTIWITLDASGSMDSSGPLGRGTKWKSAIYPAVAIASACERIQSIDVVIEARVSGHGDVPINIILYNSKKHKIRSRVKDISEVIPEGGTPEGLCYAGRIGELERLAQTRDVIFFNVSDGAPFGPQGYQGQNAADHTSALMSRLRRAGISILSYFVTDDAAVSEHSYEARVFKAMYGADAIWTGPLNLQHVAKAINNRLMRKG